MLGRLVWYRGAILILFFPGKEYVGEYSIHLNLDKRDVLGHPQQGSKVSYESKSIQSPCSPVTDVATSFLLPLSSVTLPSDLITAPAGHSGFSFLC